MSSMIWRSFRRFSTSRDPSHRSGPSGVVPGVVASLSLGIPAPPPFERFLDAQGPTVMRFLVAAVGPEHADDAYQETFLSALRAYPRVRDDGRLDRWILRIASRTAIDHHRARARRPEPRAAGPDRPPAGGGPGPPAGGAGAARRRGARRRRGAPAEATRRGGAPPSARPSVSRDRRDPRVFRRGRAGQRARRSHDPPGACLVNSTELRTMVTVAEARAGARRADDLVREAADRAGLIDVAIGVVDSPLGELFVAVTRKGVACVGFDDQDRAALEDRFADGLSPRVVMSSRATDDVRKQLDEY